MSKKQKVKGEYKYINNEELIKLRSLSPEELNSKYVEEMRFARTTRKNKKNDQKLNELNELIKEHQKRDCEENDTISNLKSQISEQKEIRDEAIEEQLTERSDLNKEWSKDIRSHLERAEAILNIVSGRILK